MATKKPKKTGKPSATIALNKRAKHDYFIETRFEAGLVLQGWEVKSIRAGKVQISESYVFLREAEVWLYGSVINPLLSASTHIHPDPGRARKLLLNRNEINKLVGAVDRKGYTLVPLAMYWKKGFAKLEVGLAKGKKDYDKRATQKDHDWKREKARILKHG